MSENNGSLVVTAVTALAVGALVGAGLALLFAPRSGQETREALAQKGRDVRDRAGVASALPVRLAPILFSRTTADFEMSEYIA